MSAAAELSVLCEGGTAGVRGHEQHACPVTSTLGERCALQAPFSLGLAIRRARVLEC